MEISKKTHSSSLSRHSAAQAYMLALKEKCFSRRRRWEQEASGGQAVWVVEGEQVSRGFCFLDEVRQGPPLMECEGGKFVKDEEETN